MSFRSVFGWPVSSQRASKARDVRYRWRKSPCRRLHSRVTQVSCISAAGERSPFWRTGPTRVVLCARSSCVGLLPVLPAPQHPLKLGLRVMPQLHHLPIGGSSKVGSQGLHYLYAGKSGNKHSNLVEFTGLTDSVKFLRGCGREAVRSPSSHMAGIVHEPGRGWNADGWTTHTHIHTHTHHTLNRRA